MIPIPAFRAGESGGLTGGEEGEGEGRDVEIEGKAAVDELRLISKVHLCTGNQKE